MGPRSTQTQARGETRCTVAQALAPIGRTRLRQPTEHRSTEPAVDEWANLTRRLEAIGQGLVGQAAVLPLALVLHAGRDADEHQTTDGQVGTQGPCRPIRAPSE